MKKQRCERKAEEVTAKLYRRKIDIFKAVRQILKKRTCC